MAPRAGAAFAACILVLLAPSCLAANPKPKGAVALPASPTRVYSTVNTGSLRQVRAVDSSFLFDAYLVVG